MAVVSRYFDVWGGFYHPSIWTMQIQGKDFNPSVPAVPNNWLDERKIWWTFTTNLSNFRYWHEILATVGYWENNWSSDETWMIRTVHEFPWGNVWETRRYRTIEPNYIAIAWSYSGIDYDEFEMNWSVKITQMRNDQIIAQKTINFTWYDTSWSAKHTNKAWYLRVQGRNLYFIDWIHWKTWYKHKIDYDTWYVWYEDVNKAGYIWIDWRRIYYIDEYWDKRRTYEARNMVDYNTKEEIRYVWTDKAWYIRAAWEYDDDVTGYWHLLFISNNWNMYRIMNWPVF